MIAELDGRSLLRPRLLTLPRVDAVGRGSHLVGVGGRRGICLILKWDENVNESSKIIRL